MWHDILLLNRLTRALIGIALVLFAWVGIKWLAARPEFAFRRIVIESHQTEPLQRVEAQAFAARVLPGLKGTFLNMNLDQARAAVEALPWVRRASVRRQWPGTLVVKIEEHRVLALWGVSPEGAVTRMVNPHSEIFTAPLAEKRDSYAILHGPAGAEREVVRMFADMRTELAKLQMEPRTVLLSPRLAWSVKLDNGVTIELGREQAKSSVRERLARLIATYRATVGTLARRIDSVDVRYPNGYAVHIAGYREWADRNTAAAAAGLANPRAPGVMR